MKKQKLRGFKGFGTPPTKKYRQIKCNGSGEWVKCARLSNPQIDKQLKLVEERTRYNRASPSALENFKKLVKEGNTEKLTEYFKQYGIDPNIARLNLENLIAEELRDLSGS